MKIKTIKIDYERLKEILEAVEKSKDLPLHMRTYKINDKEDYFLEVLIKNKKEQEKNK